MNRDPKQVLTEWLVLSAQQGNEAAFRELHELWRADLRRFCLSRVERDDAASDILSDVWLSIARGIHRLEDPACFPRWAFRIVESRSIDWIRTQSLDRRREAMAVREADELTPAPAVAPEPSEQALRLRDLIPRLPEEQRQLLHLFYFAERSVAEIADVLRLPVGTVKSRLSSLRETLKQMLEKKCHE